MIENHSPTDKAFTQNEELLYNTAPSTVNPVSVSTVVQIPRIGYDCNPYVQAYPPSGTSFQPAQQQIFAPSGTFTSDIYSAAPHNMVLTSGGQVSFSKVILFNCYDLNVKTQFILHKKKCCIFYK